MSFRPYQDAEMFCVCEQLKGMRNRGSKEGCKEIKISVPYKECQFYYSRCMNSIVVAFLC